LIEGYAPLGKEGVIEVLLFPLAGLSLVYIVIDTKRGRFACVPELIVHSVAGTVRVRMVVNALVVDYESYVDNRSRGHVPASINRA